MRVSAKTLLQLGLVLFVAAQVLLNFVRYAVGPGPVTQRIGAILIIASFVLFTIAPVIAAVNWLNNRRGRRQQ